MQLLFEMKLQAIRSKGRAGRLFVNVPRALAAALDMHPGERLRWQLLNRSDLRLIRLDAPEPKKSRQKMREASSAESAWVVFPA
jgi:hypothetical protein